MTDEIGDCLELADTLTTLNTAFAHIKVEDDAELEVIECENYLARAHLNLDLVVPIQVELHQDLLNEGLIRNAIAELDHLAVITLAVKQLVEKVRLLLLGNVND